jgi:hypothetical protein
MMINKLIELFEDMYYEQKERIADAITKILQERCKGTLAK